MRLVVVAVASVLMLASCQSHRTVVGTFPPETPSPTPVPSPTPAPTPIVVTTTTLFHTPSNNIGCVMTKEGAPLYARCDIGRRTWKAPKKPKDCPNDFGNGLFVEDGKKAGFVCAGDTVLGQGQAMRYGQTLRMGVLACDVEAAGVTCTNDASRHGFFISRTSYRLY